MAVLEGGAGARAFASGMAAITAVATFVKAGEHVVCSDMTYGGTHRYYTKILARYGVEFSFVDTSDAEEVRRAFRDKTRLLHLESPTNPTMTICDIALLSRDRPRARRPRRRGQHVRVPLPPEAARPGSGPRRPLDDEVPERPLRFGRRHRRRGEPRARRVALVRSERLGSDPLAARLLARAARHQDSRGPHGAPRGERPRGRAVSRRASEGEEDLLPGPSRSPAARAREEADARLRRHDLLRPRLLRRRQPFSRRGAALLPGREPRRSRDA